MYLEQDREQTEVNQQMEPRSYLPNFPLGSKRLLRGTEGRTGHFMFRQCGTDQDLRYESTKTWQTLDSWGTWGNLLYNYFWQNATF